MQPLDPVEVKRIAEGGFKAPEQVYVIRRIRGDAVGTKPHHVALVGPPAVRQGVGIFNRRHHARRTNVRQVPQVL